jgi:hypothetical protein
MEVGVANAGIRQTFRAISWALDWATARGALGGDPSVDQVAEWWNQSRRTAFRNQAAFREAFPTIESPAEMFATPEAQQAFQDVADALDGLSALKQARAIERASVALGQLPAI